MDDHNNIEQLFQKFIDNTITKKEYDILMDFIKYPNSQEKIKEMMDIHWKGIVASAKKKTSEDEEILFELIMSRVDEIEKTEEQQNRPKSIWGVAPNFLYGIAASIIVVIGLFYGYQNDMFFKEQVSSSSMELDPNAITLKLDNGNVEVVSVDQQRNISDVRGNVVGYQNGKQISYNTGQPTLKELVYNELTVPYGEKFDLVLSDGTKVKVNSGTVIKYPVQFISGEKRKVFVKGEAYFDVTEDIAHPFVVNANDINVEVLGTEFNVSSYPEDHNINTVLVEGSVKIYNKYKEQIPESHIMLTPGNMAAWDKSKKKIEVKPVDIEIYTAWKDGVLLFKKSSFGNIRKKLERYYDITIENKYGFLESQVYTATFDNESLEEVVEAFKEDTPFEYSIENDKLIITDSSIK
ncbi:FecR family protein [Flagellimonas pacifica]|uniref:FecR family protein n=1 Tax=Flagellimonas pacifica TaxID=1247520 RepID=A0A285MTD3_9FLAO|nr:FecR family protein [Allomuricauda parva]SNZ00469.1 FecR family protein [Allomuricauda parva]